MSRFRTAVVTGGAGFLGSHLCSRLVADRVSVICIDNFSTSVRRNIAHLQRESRFELLEHDVTEPLPIDRPTDLVIHLASPASPVDYARMPIETMLTGSAGTLHALELAQQYSARFVLASTSEAYGDPLVHPQPESYWGNVNPVGPRAVYDEAKRYAEALCTAFRTARGADTAIVRIFNTYGPYMRTDDGRAIPTFIAQAVAGRPVTVAGDGRQTRSVAYVDDTVEGLLAVAESDLAGPVNIGNPDEVSVLELARRVIAAAGSNSVVEHIPPAPDDPRVRCPDISLIERELGWRPTVDWATGIRRTMSWFTAVGAVA